MRDGHQMRNGVAAIVVAAGMASVGLLAWFALF